MTVESANLLLGFPDLQERLVKACGKTWSIVVHDAWLFGEETPPGIVDVLIRVHAAEDQEPQPFLLQIDRSLANATDAAQRVADAIVAALNSTPVLWLIAVRPAA
jgi:hypothetical protein